VFAPFLRAYGQASAQLNVKDAVGNNGAREDTQKAEWEERLGGEEALSDHEIGRTSRTIGESRAKETTKAAGTTDPSLRTRSRRMLGRRRCHAKLPRSPSRVMGCPFWCPGHRREAM
jgi:hypothetical protein